MKHYPSVRTTSMTAYRQKHHYIDFCKKSFPSGEPPTSYFCLHGSQKEFEQFSTCVLPLKAYLIDENSACDHLFDHGYLML
mmetsp:Transcript_6462/g.16093  ORF Transcript_6462/g.16093 Transcript_6462/m.16093 type:complete len:81 (-) Transcript_6462:25-267(-)